MTSEPFLQCGVVGFVQVVPEDQAMLPLGVRANDGKHAVYPSARFDAQAEQGVEGFGQINRDFPACAVAHHGQDIGEGIGEILAEQAGAAPVSSPSA